MLWNNASGVMHSKLLSRQRTGVQPRPRQSGAFIMQDASIH
jgi:hypothetical protein